MPNITFFHHERADDGRRTGLSVDGRRDEELELFDPGDEEEDFDPTIRWYIDVRMPVATPFQTRSEVLAWFNSNQEIIRSAIEHAAEKLESGMDSDGAPWSFTMNSPAGPVRVSISAQRRLDSLQISKHLHTLLDRDWPAFLKKFQQPVLATV